MMKVCLVSALSETDFGDPKLTLDTNQKAIHLPPLGVLSLAAVLCDRGISPQFVDLNKLFFDFLEHEGNGKSSDFLTFVIQHIETLSFDILGLSTICSSFPFTIQIAQEVKKFHPNVKIILGGPQASLVDIPTMKAFPFIDFVVRGEAEDTFPLLLEAFSSMNSSLELEKIRGITFRKGTEITRNPNASPILDLDSLPLPSYYLDPNITEYKSLPLEVGRGCPFNCVFCSTSDFFNRKFRLKSPQKIIEQMKFIKDTYGINKINFIHDNFTVNRKKVVEFCESLLRCEEEFSWSCSARADQIDDELIALMAKVGCKGIFFGIETGSARLQRVIKKKLNLSDALLRIQCADQHGIYTAVSLITAFPEETKDDLRDTINFFVDMLRFNNVEPRINILAPLAGTQIHSKYKNKLVLDRIYSEMSFQGFKQNQADFEMIQAYPEVFPNFYSIPTTHVDRAYFKEVRDFVAATYWWFRWLPLALFQDNGDMLNVFDRWRMWRASQPMDNSAGELPYYRSRQFAKDFIEFVLTCYNKEMATAKTVISTIVDIENFLLPIVRNLPAELHEEHRIFSLASFPYKPAGLKVAQLNVDYKELIQCLRSKTSLKQVSANNTTIAFRVFDQEQKEVNVRLLNPLSKELLDMCDGSRTVKDIIYQFSSLKAHIDGIDGISSEKVCFFGLIQLYKQELIEVSSRQIKKTTHADVLEEKL